jgi:hypothetical protein
MVDFIIAGLCAGLIAFVAFFIFSFLFLGLIFGAVQLFAAVFRILMAAKAPIYREQAA